MKTASDPLRANASHCIVAKWTINRVTLSPPFSC